MCKPVHIKFKMAKNYIIKSFRISKEQHDLISKVCEVTGFEKQKIVRWLLNKSLEQLKADCQDVGGMDKLSFNVKEISVINNR